MDKQELLEILKQKLGLHQKITIVYMVSPRFKATFFTTDGEREVAYGTGETILEALQNLEKMVAGFDGRR